MWTQAERSPEAQALYAAAEADRAANPDRYRLDVDAVTAAAFAKGGLSEADDGDWRAGLEIYLASAREEGRLNALGVRSIAGTASGRLQARRGMARALEAAPERQARTVDRPVFILGGWRTGTTLLQRLMSALPGLRGLFPAELSAPWRFAGLDPAAREALIDAGEAAHRRLHLLNPAMASIHPSGGRLEEECVLAMGADFRNWGFTSTLRCPAYARWLATQDFVGSYRRYRDVLRLLDDGSGRRWLLKAPAHTAELASLLTVFPDACLVHLHRDVVQTVTSGASLFAVFRSTYSDAVDARDVGRYQLDATAAWFDRAMAARDARPEARIVDVAFTDLAADPAGVARKLCAACDVDWTEASEAAAAARLAELNRQHGVHRYAPEDFGLDPDEVLERFAVYRGRFGLR
ncbi:MAG: sulfotransferase [Phenylobacterium sp.]|uniref:sulfotransferase family protein n=1 Tax=Phenylobacterium sp. TaxID=1871053 RepID=UPI001A3C07BE|nr:sulfotransferase [Phenylobacterium sp.]MBL8552796.1 sulfotransferase [Phenylobacterium sp.]